MSTISIKLEFGKTDVEKESKGIQSVHIVFHKIIYLDFSNLDNHIYVNVSSASGP